MRTIALAVVVLAFTVVPAALPEANESPAVLSVKAKTHALPPVVVPNVGEYVRRLQGAERSTVRTQLTASRNVIAFWENRGHWLRATRHAKCWDVPWQRSCTAARASYRLHTSLMRVAEKRLKWELPLTNDWVTAVRIAQRVYPGTDQWMLAISDREGGWGPWVWYSGSCGNPPCLWQGYHVGNDFLGADTVGGWQQFRFSTFAPYWRGAIKDLRSRGYIIPKFPDRGGPAEYQPWLDPLGQALTAGYMRYYGKDGHHWDL